MLGTLVLGPFAEPKGPRLPGRNPASLVHVNHAPFMSLSHTQVISPEQYGSFLESL